MSARSWPAILGVCAGVSGCDIGPHVATGVQGMGRVPRPPWRLGGVAGVLAGGFCVMCDGTTQQLSGARTGSSTDRLSYHWWPIS